MVHNISRCFANNFLAREALEHCILHSQGNAATKIQAVWRGYCCRKTYKENKSKMKAGFAVLVIQRSVREWLHKKKADKLETREAYFLEILDESKIPALQQQIDNWSKNSNGNFESHEKLQLQLQTMEEQLKSFYEKAASRNSRTERCQALCTQIEAISSLLTDLPSLDNCDQVDFSMFRTPVVSDAKMARLRHKQELKARNAPWWKQLTKQMESVSFNITGKFVHLGKRRTSNKKIKKKISTPEHLISLPCSIFVENPLLEQMHNRLDTYCKTNLPSKTCERKSIYTMYIICNKQKHWIVL